MWSLAAPFPFKLLFPTVAQVSSPKGKEMGQLLAPCTPENPHSCRAGFKAVAAIGSDPKPPVCKGTLVGGPADGVPLHRPEARQGTDSPCTPQCIADD